MLGGNRHRARPHQGRAALATLPSTSPPQEDAALNEMGEIGVKDSERVPVPEEAMEEQGALGEKG